MPVSPTVLKTTGGDFLLVWRLGGLPFVGREEWEIEHRHNTFNRLLQTLRAPDFVNVAFWVHDVRRHRRVKDQSRFEQSFNQQMSDTYFEALSAPVSGPAAAPSEHAAPSGHAGHRSRRPPG